MALSPVIMKKGRPGTRITVLSPPERAALLGRILLTESTTIGYRRRRVVKQVLERKTRTLKTPYGEVRIKESYLQEQLITRKPEYDDCRRIAAERDIPLRQVYNEIQKMLDSNDQ